MARSRFEALRMGFKQDKEGYILTLRLHPSDVDQETILDQAGQRYYITMARVDEDEQEVDHKVKTQGEKLVQICGIVCNDKDFQAWLVKHGHALEATEKDAAEAVRSIMNVGSRSELKTNVEAQKIFKALLAESGF